MDLGARIAEHRTYLIRRAIWLGVAPQDAEDIVGDVVVTALSKAGEFVDVNLRGWLNIILGFHFKHYRRKQLRRRREFGLVGDGEDGLEIAFDIPVPGSQLPALQLGEALRALASLPERDRDIIETVTICGMTYADYAAKCAIPIGTVKSRLSRAHEVFQSRVAEGAGAHRAAPASAQATPRARQSTAVDTRAAERRAPAAAAFPPAAQDWTPAGGHQPSALMAGAMIREQSGSFPHPGDASHDGTAPGRGAHPPGSGIAMAGRTIGPGPHPPLSLVLSRPGLSEEERENLIRHAFGVAILRVPRELAA